MSTRITIEQRGPTPGVMKREQNAMSKTSFEAVGKFWGNEIRPKHFQVSATAEYGYRRREPGYTRRKQAQYGHRRPFVFTGESEQRSKSFRVYATRSYALVTMNMPALNFFGGSEEFAVVTQAEAEACAAVYEKTYDEELVKLERERSVETVT